MAKFAAGDIDTSGKFATGVVDLRISPRIFEKIWNGPIGILWGWGETDSWKKTKQKISWHCPFKNVAFLFRGVVLPVCSLSLEGGKAQAASYKLSRHWYSILVSEIQSVWNSVYKVKKKRKIYSLYFSRTLLVHTIEKMCKRE